MEKLPIAEGQGITKEPDFTVPTRFHLFQRPRVIVGDPPGHIGCAEARSSFKFTLPPAME
jgi:hypothetical protein